MHNLNWGAKQELDLVCIFFVFYFEGVNILVTSLRHKTVLYPISYY